MPEVAVLSEITGTVWKIEIQAGDKVAENDTLLVLESMKMEIPVLAPESGTVRKVLVNEGENVSEGQPVVLIDM